MSLFDMTLIEGEKWFCNVYSIIYLTNIYFAAANLSVISTNSSLYSDNRGLGINMKCQYELVIVPMGHIIYGAEAWGMRSTERT